MYTMIGKITKKNNNNNYMSIMSIIHIDIGTPMG